MLALDRRPWSERSVPRSIPSGIGAEQPEFPVLRQQPGDGRLRRMADDVDDIPVAVERLPPRALVDGEHTGRTRERLARLLDRHRFSRAVDVVRTLSTEYLTRFQLTGRSNSNQPRP